MSLLQMHSGGTDGSISHGGGRGGPADESVELDDGCVAISHYSICGMQQAQTVIRYPLLLGANKCLEARGDPEAQLMEERRL